MAQITKAMASDRSQLLAASLVPDYIAKAIPQDELADRVAHATDLSRRAQHATDPVLRRAYKERAQAILQAQPRPVTERQHRELIAKAAQAPSAVVADAIRRQARELVEEMHPMAPRRSQPVAVAKAAPVRGKPTAKRTAGKPVLVQDSRGRLGVVGRKAIVRKASDAGAGELTAVFSQDGELLGVCPADAIQPVAGTGKPAADQAQPAQPAGQSAPAAQSAAVAKARARAAAQAPRLVPATDRLAGVVLQGWRDAARKSRTAGRTRQRRS